MFICLGSNDENKDQYGTGPTIQKAIENWASKNNYLNEYENYQPDIYHLGEMVKVVVKIEFEIVK